MTMRVMKGRTLLETENLTESSLQIEANKKNTYKAELQRQMDEKKQREKQEKDRIKKQDADEEERVKKEIEEKNKKFVLEKESKIKERKEKEAQEKQQEEDKDREKEREKAEKRKNVRSGSKGAIEGKNNMDDHSRVEVGNMERKREKSFEIENIQEMIRTNHDWINTKLSKEYVLYKKREESGLEVPAIGGSPIDNFRGKPPISNNPTKENFRDNPTEKQLREEATGRKEVDYHRQELFGQLDRTKVEPVLLLSERLWMPLVEETKQIENF